MGCCVNRKNKVIEPSILCKHMLSTSLSSFNSLFSTQSRRFSFLKTRSGRLGDYYENVRKIGTGGFGIVFKATERQTKIQRAIKQLPKKRVRLHSILSEVQHLRELDHPNILKVYEIIESEDHYSIATELCKGPNLLEKIQSMKNFSENDAAKYMLQIFSGLSHCHKASIVHRDIKPENLLFETPSEHSSLVKIIDFGISRKQSISLSLSEAIGTAYYIAPEILSRSYNEKCDLWSCGVLLYIMLCGEFPFKGKNTYEILTKVRIGFFSMDSELWNGISPGAKDLIKKLLTKNPHDRISAEEAYNHPWTQQQSRWFIKNLKVNADYLRRLEKFRIDCKFKKAALGFIATQLTCNEDTYALRSLFLKLDTNGDGTLTSAELIEGFKEAQMYNTSILEWLTQRFGDSIELTDFVVACLDWERELTFDRLKKTFELFSDNGVITQDGLRAIFANLNIPQCETDEIFVLREGSIDIEEFTRIMKSVV